MSTRDMPSVDGRIYSFQTIHAVDQLLGALSIMVSLSVAGAGGVPAGGSATGILFGVTLAPVPFLWNLYTYLFRKQVLAVAGIAGTQLGSPDTGVSAVQIKFRKWEKMQQYQRAVFLFLFWSSMSDCRLLQAQLQMKQNSRF